MSETEPGEVPPRDEMDADVVIVGAGPAGLAAAIRLKQCDPELSVIVLEKGAEVGAHILSGAIIDPAGIDALLPGWRKTGGHPFDTEVTEERFHLLSERGAIGIPHWLMPRLMHNSGNYVVSLAQVCRWLAVEAERLGVQVFAGFAATDVLFDGQGAVCGVATGDTGLGKDGRPGPNFARGVALRSKYLLLAEGAHGSLSKRMIRHFGLGEGREPPKYGLGIKELWEVAPEKHQPGRVEHSFGWPLGRGTNGGSFIYHMGGGQVAIGYVVHLDYRNPHISPFSEFQRFKTHRSVRPLLEGGRRIAYGARAITEGGYQSVPKLTFAGGALIGCAAGFVNLPRIKGSHNAVVSGLLAANAVAAAIKAGRAHDELTDYETGWRGSAVGRDLWAVRNVKPLWSRFGTPLGIALGGLDMWATTLGGGWSPFGTMRHRTADHAALEPASNHAPITYPRPDGVVSFDRLSSVYLSNTNHAEDQPVHLRVADPALHRRSEHGVFGGPSAHYCPAGVYEWRAGADGTPGYVINASNCVHCKTCDIKDPNQNIEWVPPIGGDGPSYGAM